MVWLPGTISAGARASPATDSIDEQGNNSEAKNSDQIQGYALRLEETMTTKNSSASNANEQLTDVPNFELMLAPDHEMLYFKSGVFFVFVEFGF